MKPVVLSKRLQAVAGMVTPGNRVCDVGCDHGFVSIYLIEQGVSPSVLAMDVRSGPLSAAREHIAERGLESVITTRLSDGLHNYNIGEADTLICAGMGGALMRKILSEKKEKTDSFCELVLQPQSEIEQFRTWLREQGYRVVDENMIEEEGKFYPLMKVMPEDTFEHSEYTAPADDSALCKLYERYGFYLLSRQDATLRAYLWREEKIYGEILENLEKQGLQNEKRALRYKEVSALLEECRLALKLFTTQKSS